MMPTRDDFARRSRRPRARLAGALLAVAGFTLFGRAQAGDARRPAAPPTVAATADSVRITFITVPPQKKVTVTWGKKRLGVIAPHQPLIVTRPRDSGPLDVVVECQGFLPVQTRAMTFADNKVAVKLTPLAEKNTLLGYRAELPPPPTAPIAPAARGDAGVAPLPPLPLPPLPPPPPQQQPRAPDGATR
jgi:hypothetical protein